MRALRFLVLVVVVIFFIGAKKTSDKVYVLERAEMMNRPEGRKLGVIWRGVELKIIEEKEDWVKVQVVGWIPRESVTMDTSEVPKASEEPIGVKMLSKTLVKAATPESTDKIVIKVRFMNQMGPGGASGAFLEKQGPLGPTVISNIPRRNLIAFAGVIRLKDNLGRLVSSKEVSFDKPLAFGETLEWDWAIPCAKDDDKKSALREGKLENYSVRFFAKQVKYAAGSEETFGKEEYILRAE